MTRETESQDDASLDPASKKRVVDTPEIAVNPDKKKKHEEWWHRQEKALAKWEKKKEEKEEKEKQQQQGEEPKQQQGQEKQQQHDNEPKDLVEDDSCSWPSTCSLELTLSPGWCVYGEGEEK